MKNICNASSFVFADKYIESIAEFGELVFWEEEKTKLTYRMFHRNVCAAASYIAQLNSPLVALYIQKPLYMTIGIIACLYSGITFIPCGEDNYLHISSTTEYKDVPVIMDDEIEDAIKKGADFSVNKTINENWTAIVAFSSGTMSEPKGVCLSYHNIMSDVLSGLRAFDCKRGTRYLHILPLYHMFGISVELLPVLFSGGTICCSKSPYFFIEDVIKYRVDISFVPAGVAEVLLKVMRAKNDYSFKLGNLKTLLCGGAKLPKEISEGLMEYNILALGSYGLTECSPGIAINSVRDHKFGSAGKVIDCCEVAIGDNSEILVKGDNLFERYFGDDNPQVDSEGWFHTKDYGYIDAEGFLWIEGRIDDIIVLSDGHKYSAEKYESMINKIDGVQESLLINYKADGLTCYVYSDDGEKSTIEKQIYAMSHAITKIVFTDQPLPKNGLGKLKRYL